MFEGEKLFKGIFFAIPKTTTNLILRGNYSFKSKSYTNANLCALSAKMHQANPE